MRWSWIDSILEVEKGRRLVAVKNISLAEDVLHDHFPAQTGPDGSTLGPLPIMPASLLIEGMAQTAGLLVGHMNDFKEKVILAKIARATFHREVGPGRTVRFEATIERIEEGGAHTVGTIRALDHKTQQWEEIGEVELLFSHIDRNMAGTAFPDENFVFTENFRTLLAASGML
jgi:3-hydroxyacyl-[acyl-carrier-protein] dehydratase